MSTWGLTEGTDGSLGLEPEAAVANPLLAVMLARLQEGCRLMWASGEPGSCSWRAAAFSTHFTRPSQFADQWK